MEIKIFSRLPLEKVQKIFIFDITKKSIAQTARLFFH